jgi:hypothetical protein
MAYSRTKRGRCDLCIGKTSYPTRWTDARAESPRPEPLPRLQSCALSRLKSSLSLRNRGPVNWNLGERAEPR